MTVAWIGLGNMGGPMAANLAAAGHEVTGFDLSDSAVRIAAENVRAPTGSLSATCAPARRAGATHRAPKYRPAMPHDAKRAEPFDPALNLPRAHFRRGR